MSRFNGLYTLLYVFKFNNMKKIQYFKALKNTKRFRKNQKVWVCIRHANHLEVYSKWRGKGRYTYSTLDRWDSGVVGELKEIEVDDEFHKRVMSKFN